MSAIVSQAVPAVRPEARFKLKATPENVRIARELVDITLISWALNFLSDPAKLIVSELFTNAMEHGESSVGDVWLLLTHEGERVAIGVWDSNPQMPEMGSCDLFGESGRGLYLVASLADTHGSYRVENPQGKIVWARLKT